LTPFGVRQNICGNFSTEIIGEYITDGFCIFGTIATSS